jgi:hypothetical protein
LILISIFWLAIDNHYAVVGLILNRKKILDKNHKHGNNELNEEPRRKQRGIFVGSEIYFANRSCASRLLSGQTAPSRELLFGSSGGLGAVAPRRGGYGENARLNPASNNCGQSD